MAKKTPRMTKSVICLRLLDTIMRWLADYPSTEKTSNTVQSLCSCATPATLSSPFQTSHSQYTRVNNATYINTNATSTITNATSTTSTSTTTSATAILSPPYHLPHQNLYLWRCQSEPICVNFSFSATLQNDFMQTLISHKFTNMAQIDGKGVIFVWWCSLLWWSWWQSGDAIRPKE